MTAKDDSTQNAEHNSLRSDGKQSGDRRGGDMEERCLCTESKRMLQVCHTVFGMMARL